MRDRGEREREETRREEGRDERRGEMTSRQRHMRAGPSQQDLSYMVDFDLLMRAGALATDQSYPYSHNLSRLTTATASVPEHHGHSNVPHLTLRHHWSLRWPEVGHQ